MPDTAMIFAAGRGTRMGTITQTTPKPLIKVAGKPLIDHAFDLIDDSPIEHVIVNVHHLGPLIVDHLQGRNVTVSYEDEQLLETGGGLKQALSLHEAAEIVTLNSDAVWAGANPIQALLRGWNPDKMDALLMLVRPENAIGHNGQGDFLVAEDQTLIRGPGLIYPGCQIIKSRFVSEVVSDVFSLNIVWDRLLANRRVFGIEYAGKWCDVGHPIGIELAENMIGSSDV